MTPPIWDEPAIESDGPLVEDRTTDVCVIGGGIAGLTTAYLLARAGRAVIVLDSAAIGGGESWRTTAHLVNALDRGWKLLVDVHGEEHARLAAESHTHAIEAIGRIAREERIDCDFARIDGYLVAATADDSDVLDAEREAAHAVGLGDVELLPRVPLAGVETGRCLRYPRQGRVHATRYLRGLAAAARRYGALLATPVQAVDVENGDPLRVRTAAGPTVTAGAVVVATNTPFSLRLAIHTKQAAYRTYAVAACVPRGSIGDALYWDTEDPFHYARLSPGAGGEDVLIVGGEDHKTGQDDQGHSSRFARLESWMRARFDAVGRVTARWSGQVTESMDGLAFIGPIDPGSRLYVVTGDSGNGYTHGTIGGMLLSDLIADRLNPWSATYDPSRIRLRALPTFAHENLNVARQLGDWIHRGTAADTAHVAPGTGEIVRRGLTPVAVYRDPAGRVHERSAVCPHLGCIVRWNAAERSWDCPCHGSRFDATGRVVHGPAHRDLAPVSEESERVVMD
jgi:glycine/D-amino acid oxidase-like deaminating enzyme/nitrite reductase/ring-hydroxylating ferredoxin subunit